MSLWIKIVIGIIVFVALIVVLVFYLTAGMTRSAEGFFQAVGQKDMAKAHSFLSEGFRANVDEHSLEGFLAANSIAGFKEAHWSSRKVENGRGVLSGSIITDTGGVVPISLELVKENGGWKIYAIRKPQAGLRTDEPQAAVQIPPGAEIFQLVATSMRDFAVSVQQEDMSYFRGTLAQRWQNQVSVEELNRIFAPFNGQGANLLKLAGARPQPTTSPVLTASNALVVEGYYPAGAKHVTFKHTYDQENGAWKLIGFQIEIVDAPASSGSAGGQ